MSKLVEHTFLISETGNKRNEETIQYTGATEGILPKKVSNTECVQIFK
jgi:hypothetical protein